MIQGNAVYQHVYIVHAGIKENEHATMIDACRKGETIIVKQLIEKGANIHHQDKVRLHSSYNTKG